MTERKELELMAQAGTFDCIALLPCGAREFESQDNPGWIHAIEADTPGIYHPLDSKGFPVFTVLLDKSGIVVDRNPR